MNIANAVGFLVLGTVMQIVPELAPAADSLVAGSVRAQWTEFMSWVVGGIGSTYVVSHFAQRLPSVLANLVPARLPQLLRAKPEAATLPEGARVGVSR